MHRSDIRGYREACWAAFDKRKQFQLEYRLRRRDGQYRWMLDHGVPRFSAARQFLGYVGCSVDITERKQAEQVMRRARDQSQAQLRAIMDHSPLIIFVKDSRGRYLHFNRRFAEVFHLTRAQAVGKTDAELFPTAQAAMYRANDFKVVQARAPLQFEETAMHDDGIHTSIVTKFPLFSASGKLRAIGGIVTDITERKRLEESVLRVSDREQRRMAQDLHDGLGQQLAGVWCLSDVLRKSLASASSPQAVQAEKITSVLRLAVRQTRGLAHGLHPVPAEPGGLRSALAELARQVNDLFAVGCEFQCPEPVEVQDNTAATHLYRIAQEAINNAVRHGRAKKIKISLSLMGNETILSVSDDGCGFKKKQRPTKGMGLQIINYRASMIGGRVVFGRNGGRGVTCSVRIENLNGKE
jgi:PAS domain S-box-containing protein